MFVIAHLSDTHFDGEQRNAERTARVLGYLADLVEPVDVVLVTGDIADHGTIAEYEQARETLASGVPLLVCPGNHDVRGPFRKALLDEPEEAGPINRAHRVGGVVFAMCDSSIPGRDDGWLAEETLAWLDGVLAEADAAGEPAFVCFHHPPVLIGQRFLDGIRQFGEDRLAEVIIRHPSVTAILCGHAHTGAVGSLAGVPVLIAPGVASTLVLPWERGDVLDFDAPPGLVFHVLPDDGRLASHYRVVL